MKNKNIYIKPCAKALNFDTGTLLAASGGISGEIPDIPWGEKNDDSNTDDADIEVAHPLKYSLYDDNDL